MEVSVLIFTYNHVNTIKKSIKSILSQIVNFKIEIIVIDDASTDGTSEICESFFVNKLNYIKNEKNVGLIKNLEKGILLAKGKFISFHSGDDICIDKKKLKKQVDYLNKKNVGLVHTNFKIYDEEKEHTIVNNLSNKKEIRIDDLLNENSIVACTVLCRSEIVKKAVKDNILKLKNVIGDYEIWLYISEKHKMGYLDDETILYRRNNTSLSNFSNKKDTNIFISKMIGLQIYFAKRNKKVFLIKERIKKHYNYMIYESLNKRTSFNINTGLINLIKIRSLNYNYLKYYIYHFFAIKYFYNLLKNE